MKEASHKLEDRCHFNIEYVDVVKAFTNISTNRSQGPDNICGQQLKSCAKQLCPLFIRCFNKSLQTHFPKRWKTTVFVPVPKTNCPKTLNDLDLLR